MGEIRDAIDKGPGSLSCTTTQLLSMSGEKKISAAAQLLSVRGCSGGLRNGRRKGIVS